MGSRQPPELVFLKLGGSLITDKTCPEATRWEVLRRLADEIVSAMARSPGLRLLVGHGSGSYGHVAGQRHGTRNGVHDEQGWRGFALTASAAQRLNRIVTDGLLEAGLPAWSLQPSASAMCRDGELVHLDARPTEKALHAGLVPIVYGDVALDDVRGGTIISTEQIFVYLAHRLRPSRVILAGAVPGVLLPDGEDDAVPYPQTGPSALLREITPDLLRSLEDVLGRSHGVDVTGGMLAKVALMCGLVRELPDTQVRLISGLEPGLVQQVLCDPGLEAGTAIRAHRQ